MPFDWTCGGLAEGLRCYRNEEFFLAHEHWEGVWLAAEEPERTFLQSLIQVAAAFHHLQRGNRAGTVSLLTRALRRLERYPDEYGGIGVDSIRDSVRLWLQALEAEGAQGRPAFPRIR
jgi:predicted metal-dependent hydrolase